MNNRTDDTCQAAGAERPIFDGANETVGKPSRACPERAWCTMTDPVEHDDYHAGDAVDLADSDGTGAVGWWAWLTEERRSHCDVTVVLEGVAGGATHEVTMTVDDLAAVLAATATPEAHTALSELLSRARRDAAA